MMYKASSPTRRLVPLLVLASCLAVPAYGQVSLFADFKARQEGDLITVILAERTAAQRASEWKNASKSNVGGSAGLSNSSDLSGHFALDAQFNKSDENRNGSVQSDLLRGTMTAIIAQTDTWGNLQIEGERQLNVNGETHVMKISGTVRINDILPDNTVLSYKIANASIEYRRAGGVKRSLLKPGRVARFGTALVLGAAAIFAATQ